MFVLSILGHSACMKSQHGKIRGKQEAPWPKQGKKKCNDVQWQYYIAELSLFIAQTGPLQESASDLKNFLYCPLTHVHKVAKYQLCHKIRMCFEACSHTMWASYDKTHPRNVNTDLKLSSDGELCAFLVTFALAEVQLQNSLEQWVSVKGEVKIRAYFWLQGPLHPLVLRGCYPLDQSIWDLERRRHKQVQVCTYGPVAKVKTHSLQGKDMEVWKDIYS